MSEIVVRRLTPSDHGKWIMLWQGYNTFYGRSVEERVSERLWSQLLRENEEPFGFCAELDGNLVGFTHYFFVFSTSDWNPRCYLQDLYTDPAARGRGAGRALIEAVYAEADRSEAAQTYWLTQEFNHTARILYDKVGRLTPFVKYQRG